MYSIRPITEAVDRAVFDCGVPALNDYLQRFARQNHERGIAKTFAITAVENARILGFHTLSFAQLAFEHMPVNLQKKLPRYPIPAMRIARIAVSRQEQGKGLGRLLLIDALHRANRAAAEAGLYAVLVDAKGEAAASFYRQFGFVPLPDWPLTLVITMKTVQKLFT